ncbi:YibE/F family protein [Sporomusa sp.]|uniref:YibE/F family protein n=1 Tax=Sporomusa sp. TaxID=2078658 RepID=UPI002C915F91|nr:YibE/F family protein [Sporomusa sp.]HWR07487.1 YibE/F family protein [Sporomusa sp.]
MKKLLLLILVMILSTGVSHAAPAAAQAVEYEKGTVVFVGPLDQSMQKQYQMAKGELVSIQLTSGPETGKVVDTFNFVSEHSAYEIKVKPGDKVVVAVTHDLGKTSYYVSDFDRFDYVYVLGGLFVLALVVFGGLIGAKSVLVIAFSVLLIFKFFIGQVLVHQYSLTLLTLAVAAVIAMATQLVISGLSKKTLAAVLGTIGGVAIAGLLSMLAIKLMHLTGLDSEEAMLLKASTLSNIDFQGVLFAGMVFGALGAVMDVTISIASAVYEVKCVHPAISFKELVQAGMNVGRDIMGTMSNTLILAYAGSSLPLMLLIASQQNAPMLKILNLNLIVTEFARALTGSIGLICAIPLTAIIAAMLLNRE